MNAPSGIESDALQYRIALEAIDIGVFEYYPDIDFFEANSIWYRLTSLTRGDGIDKLLSHFPEPKARELEEIIRSKKVDERTQFTSIYKNSELGDIWVSISGYITDSNGLPGNPYHFAGTFIDITDWKTIEQNYVQTESVLKMAFENMPVGLIYIDAESRNVEMVNSFGAEMFGYTPKYMIGKNCHDFLCDSPKSSCPVCDLDESIKNQEMTIRRPDGSVVWVLKSVIKITARKNLKLLECFFDITSQKKTEEALRSATDQLTLATQAGGVGIWKYYIDTGVEEWDDQMYRLYSASRETYPTGDLAWKERIHPDDREFQNMEIRLAFAGKKDFNTEFRIVWPDGSTHNIRALAILQNDESGNPKLLLGTNWDITQQKETENELIKSNLHLEAAGIRAHHLVKEAEAANAAKGTFLATISHEIRTPMNGVIGMTDLLLDSPLSDEQHRYAELLKTSGETLLSLINDLLDFSKIEAKKLELERKDFNFHESIRTTVSMMDINAREKSLALNISISDDVPIYVRGDAKRFRQILFNLIGNAVKFTDKGSITVQTFLDGEDVTFVTLRVEVIDTGIGIPPDKQKNLFTPFSQLDNSSTRKYGGTGLGLAISRQLAEMMGGSIGVSSDGIHGTTFTLIVRLAKSSVTGPIFDENAHGSCAEPGGNRSLQQGAAIQQVAVPIKKDEHLSILLAEDNPTNQIIARKILEKMGHSVDIVPNGEEAFNSVILKKYDLVLMDCQMPLMDGYESTRRMRARGLTLPIIAMTAHALSGDREKCIESGMSDYITKPVQMDTLAMAIARRNNPENSIASTIATTVEPELFIRDSFMSRVLNDTSLARTVIESFLGDIPTQIESLQSSAAVGDFSTAEHYAHRINGAAANLSCDRLRMYACEGERAAIDKDMDLLTSCIKRVIETFTDTKALLEAF